MINTSKRGELEGIRSLRSMRGRHGCMNEQDSDDVCVFPMSYGQSQLWYLHDMDPDSTAYNIPFAFRYKGDLDVAALRQALQIQIDRFEALRTNFDVIDGEPKQVLKAPRAIEFVVENLPATNDDRESVIRQIVDAEAKRPFDIKNDQMMRARLLNLGDNENLLLLNFHHIAVDNIAILRLKREIETTYSKILAGDASASDDDEPQCADFAVWQQENIAGELLDEKLQYWVNEYSNRESILPLPTDFVRPPVQSFSGAELTYSFSPDVSNGIRQLCRQHNLSPFIALLTILKILFFRYTRQNDITIGCPFANRTQVEFEDTVGLFMNLLPISVSISGSDSFLDLAASVESKVVKAQELQDTPFERIIQKINHDRNSSYNPLLQTWFTFQEPPMVLELADTSVVSLPIHNGGAKLDLSFRLWEEGETISGLLEYNTDLFRRDSVERMIGHFEQIVDGVVRTPDATVDELQMLTPDERQLLNHDWNDTSTTAPEQHIVDRIYEIAEANPDKTAVSWSGGTCSYGELIANANAVASFLAEQGVSRSNFVGVCQSRTADLVTTLLGIWRCGAAYLPMDPGYPNDRLRFMLEDSKTNLVIADKTAGEPLDVDDVRNFSIEQIVADTTKTIETDFESTPLSSPAYVIYTSGSTGKPKGVQVSNLAVANFLESMRNQPGFTSDDTIAAVTTISFDISVLEIFLPLIVGGQVHLVSRDAAADSSSLANEIRNCGASVFQATPSMMRLLIESGWQGQENLRLLCGGESLPIDQAQQLVTRCAELWNMYGPTETTVWSTVHRIRKNDQEVSIGKPIANTTIRVLDETLNAVPVGIPGELYIGGLGLSDGYLNRPELNEERFINDPLGENGELIYRTGDRVKWASDGSLTHIGRNDRQVKLRGFRIELQEIESIVAEATTEQNVAVVTWEAAPGDVRLVAYVAGATGTSSMQLRKLLRKKLPDFMIPQHFVEIDALPKTANGKIDRNALPPPATVGKLGEAEALEGESQQLIGDVWAEILGRSGISPSDNFFDIGGHSLVAMKVVAEVEARTGMRLTARMIVMQSLAEIAEALDRHLQHQGPANDEASSTSEHI